MKFRLFLGLTATLALLPAARADLLFKDDSGQEVRLKAPAKRIITLAPHATEILYAAGAGERLVGTVEFSDYPPAAKKVPRVGSYERLDLEAIAALKPDLVIAWETGNPAGQVEKLKALGLTVYASQPNRMEDVAAQLERFGQLAGTEATASAAAGQFRQRLENLRRGNAKKPPVRVFYQIWTAPLMTVGGPQIISDAIRLCGGENVFGKLEPDGADGQRRGGARGRPRSHRRHRHGRRPPGMAERLEQMDADDRGQARQPVPHQPRPHAAPHAAHTRRRRTVVRRPRHRPQSASGKMSRRSPLTAIFDL